MKLASFPQYELTREQLRQMQDDLGLIFCIDGASQMFKIFFNDANTVYDVQYNRQNAAEAYIKQHFYPVKKPRHAHADLMIAYANDPSIKFQYNTNGHWVDCEYPQWIPSGEYRIKKEVPQPVLITVLPGIEISPRGQYDNRDFIFLQTDCMICKLFELDENGGIHPNRYSDATFSTGETIDLNDFEAYMLCRSRLHPKNEDVCHYEIFQVTDKSWQGHVFKNNKLVDIFGQYDSYLEAKEASERSIQIKT